jgi:tRNA pseudouridine55 synthase
MGVGAAPLLGCAVRVLRRRQAARPHLARRRRARAAGARQRRVGHAGTLDPLATGVLVVLVDEATKLSPFLTGSDKATSPGWRSGSDRHARRRGPGDGARRPRRHPSRRRGRRAAALPGARNGAGPAAVLRRAARRRAQLRRGADGEATRAAAAPRGVPRGRAARLRARRQRAPAALRARRRRLAPRGRRASVPAAPELEPGPTALWRCGCGPARTPAPSRATSAPRWACRPTWRGWCARAPGAPTWRTRCRRRASPAAPPLDPVALLPFPRVRLDAVQARRIRDGQRIDATWTGRVALIDPDGALVAVADAEGAAARSLAACGGRAREARRETGWTSSLARAVAGSGGRQRAATVPSRTRGASPQESS